MCLCTRRQKVINTVDAIEHYRIARTHTRTQIVNSIRLVWLSTHTQIDREWICAYDCAQLLIVVEWSLKEEFVIRYLICIIIVIIDVSFFQCCLDEFGALRVALRLIQLKCIIESIPSHWKAIDTIYWLQLRNKNKSRVTFAWNWGQW